jgi:hypothetical protein
VPFTLSYIDLFLSSIMFLSILSFAHPIIIPPLVSCQWQNILPYLSVYSQWRKIVSAFPTSWKWWVVNSPEDCCNCYYFASTVNWIKLSARKITNVKFALYTAPALHHKTMFIQQTRQTAPLPPAFRTTSFRNFIMLRQNVISLDNPQHPFTLCIWCVN